MTTQNETTCEELIARIADELARYASGERICEIANQVLEGKFTYDGDEIVIVEKEDMDHG